MGSLDDYLRPAPVWVNLASDVDTEKLPPVKDAPDLKVVAGHLAVIGGRSKGDSKRGKPRTRSQALLERPARLVRRKGTLDDPIGGRENGRRVCRLNLVTH